MSRYPHDDPRHELDEQDARAEDALARRDREDDHAPRSREDERLQREASQTRGLSHAEFEKRTARIRHGLEDKFTNTPEDAAEYERRVFGE